MKSETRKTVSRRAFIKTASAAFAVPYIIPASALGKDGNVAPSERITFGLIGCGGQGNGVMGGALREKDTQVLAVCDVNSVNRNNTKAVVDGHYENTDCRSYKDFRELTAQTDIDAVIVATPDHWHALTTISAAKNGKDVYCEKPLTWSLGEGRAVVNAVKGNNRILQVGSMQRSAQVMKRACELVRNGYLGKISHINVGLPNGGNAQWVDEWPAPPAELDYEFYVGPAEWAVYHKDRLDWNWRWWMGFGGSQMMDWIGHHGDIAPMAMDWHETGPVEVRPVLWEFNKERNNLYDSPQKYQIDYTYADGTTMTVASREEMPEVFRNCNDTGTQWFGEDGKWLFVSRGGMKSNPEGLMKTRLDDKDFTFREERNHMRDFLDCIKTRSEPIAPVEHGHRSASIGHLGKIASILGHPLKWDPATETFTDNPAVNGMLTRKYRGDWSLENV